MKKLTDILREVRSKSVTIDGAEIEYVFDGDNIHIDRFYIPPEVRGNSKGTNALGKFIQMINPHDKYTMSTNILPDEDSEFDIDKTYSIIRHVFGKYDFVPLEIDGEVYRNDLIRYKK